MCLFKKKLKPIAEGYLPEEDGHRVYWARYGNVKGKTILFFHGGPGYNFKEYHAERVNLKKYNVILFDQRGCGKSEPLGKLENNNTQKLLSDAKRILEEQKVKEVIIKGGSWGSTLALLFSEKYNKMVKSIILYDIALVRQKDADWSLGDTKNMYPDLYEKMIKNKPKNKSIVDYYYKLITSIEKSDIKEAMDNFSNYGSSIGKLSVSVNDPVDYTKLSDKQILLYYRKNNFFLKENEILKNIKSIENKSCLIIHNRLDLRVPLSGAWDLHKVMKKSKLIIKPQLGHGVFKDKTTKKDIANFLDKE